MNCFLAKLGVKVEGFVKVKANKPFFCVDVSLKVLIVACDKSVS